MSGRGKGGKGLGKGGAKRHRKILRDNIRTFPFSLFRTASLTSQRESQSPLFAVSHAVVVSSVSPVSSTKKPEVSSKSSSKASSAMPSPTPNTPSERPSLPSMLYMLSSAKDAPSTVSVVKFSGLDEGVILRLFCCRRILHSGYSREDPSHVQYIPSSEPSCHV